MKGNEVQAGAAVLLAIVITIVAVFLIFIDKGVVMPSLSQKKMQENMKEAEKIKAEMEHIPDGESYGEEEEEYSKELKSFEVGTSQMTAKEAGNKEDADKKTEDGGEKDTEENNVYLCAYTSERLLTEEDIEELNSQPYGDLPSGKNIIQMVINEMYARYGYQFQTSEIQSYFDGKEWYQKISARNPDMDDIFKSMTETEKANVEFLSAHNTEG